MFSKLNDDQNFQKTISSSKHLRVGPLLSGNTSNMAYHLRVNHPEVLQPDQTLTPVRKPNQPRIQDYSPSGELPKAKELSISNQDMKCPQENT